MFKISTTTNKPEIPYLLNRIQDIAEKGIPTNDIRSISEKVCVRIEASKANIKANYNVNNPGSPQQVASYLSMLNDADVVEYCFIKGKWTTNKDALEPLAVMGNQFAKDILSYRKLTALQRSADSITKARERFGDGRIHPIVSLQKTNRISYSDPAVMSINKKLLWHIIAPSKSGNVLYSVDVKNQEPLITVHMLGAKELIPGLRAPEGFYEYLMKKALQPKAVCYIHVGEDGETRGLTADDINEMGLSPVYVSPVSPSTHSTFYNGKRVSSIQNYSSYCKIGTQPVTPLKVAIKLEDNSVIKLDVKWNGAGLKFNKPGILKVEGDLAATEVVPEKDSRAEFKTDWVALTYGATSYGLKLRKRNVDGDRVVAYFKGVPELAKYSSTCTTKANKLEQITYTAFGSELNADCYDSKRLRRVLMDLPIQGTGADILSMLVKHFDEVVEDRGLENKLKLVYSRHDEVIIEVEGGFVEEYGSKYTEDLLRDIFEHQVDDWTPFIVEINAVKAENLADVLEDNDDEEAEDSI